MEVDIVCTACEEVFTIEFEEYQVSRENYVVDEVALGDKIAEGFGRCDMCWSQHYIPELYDGIDTALEESRGR